MSSTTKNVVPSTAHELTAASGCLLPFIEGKKKEATDTRGVVNDFIPPDLILSLKRFTGSEASPSKGSAALLPPSKKNPTLPANNKPVMNEISKSLYDLRLVLQSPVLVRRPDNLWNHPNRRRKFKHLTSNTPCVCGAGKWVALISRYWFLSAKIHQLNPRHYFAI